METGKLRAIPENNIQQYFIEFYGTTNLHLDSKIMILHKLIAAIQGIILFRRPSW